MKLKIAEMEICKLTDEKYPHYGDFNFSYSDFFFVFFEDEIVWHHNFLMLTC